MSRWLLVSNCQTFGLANSLMLAHPGLEVDGVDIWTYQAGAERYNAEMPGYDRVVIHPDVALLDVFDASLAAHLNYLPSIEFGAYHPDTGYFEVDGTTVNGPMTAYQSILAVAAYEAGLSLAQARALYTGLTYERCGYMGDWVPQRDALVRSFRDHGIDIAGCFPRWGRGRAFMYSVNHPRIDTLWDTACQLLTALRMEALETDLRPGDNIAIGPCMPVFPEIAEALGVRGSALFKTAGYGHITLDTFLAGSFAAYAGHPRGAIRPHANYRPRYEHVLNVVRGHA